MAVPAEFVKGGVPEQGAEITLSEYQSVDKMKDLKGTQVHQQLNGYRKKNKLDIAALQLDEVERWLQP